MEIQLAELSGRKIHPEVICLSETFIEKDCESLIHIFGYTLAASYCRSKKQKRGGVCILIKSGITFKEVKFLEDHSIDNVFECCGVEIPNQNLFILCVYRTPTSNCALFFEILETVLQKFRHKFKKKKLVIAGDLNINTIKLNNKTVELFDITKNYNLTLHIDEPTRLNSCIDHLISNVKSASGELLHLGISDHNTAQLLNIPVKTKKEPLLRYEICKRDYNKGNILKFKECMSQLSFFEIYNEPDLNSAFNKFHELVLLFYGLCFPIVTVKVSNRLSKPKWLSRGLKISCKTKRALRFKYYSCRTVQNKIKYKAYSKLLRKCIHGSIKRSNHKFISESKNKCKAAWQVIKTDSCATRSKQLIDTIKKKDLVISSPNEIADEFNDYWIHLTNKTNNQVKNTLKKTVCNSMYLTPYGYDEVHRIIISLNNTNSEGYDELATKIIKSCSVEFTPILTYLINLSFSCGCFPDLLKLSIVKPLYKKGDKNLVDNYRPITIIPIFSKVLETAMHKRMVGFINKQAILRNEQHGFQKGKSTTLACFDLTSKVIDNVDAGNLTTVIFFDMSKAFDFVCHKLLLNKLEKYGIRGPAQNWLKTYLENRMQCVEITKLTNCGKLKSYKSSFKVNTYGVPQGSVLGPLLFLLYINDLPEVTSNSCTLFADDISLIMTCNYKTDMDKYTSDINNTIESIMKWLDENNLHINLNKTKYVQFGTYGRKTKQLDIKNRGVTLNEVNETSFLGVIIDKNCNWKSHVKKVCSKINKFVYVLYELTKTSARQTVLSAYYGYVNSALSYGLIIWGNSTDINRAFIAQKKCIRAIAGIRPWESCKPLFREYKILTLPCMYIFECAKFVKEHPELFTTAQQMYPKNTRRPDRLVLPKIPKTAMYHKNCHVMCIRIYNALPNDLKELPRRKFLLKLKLWLTNKTFYSVSNLFCKQI